MSYQRGDIVWLRFPFSNASSAKVRPALIISNNTINKTKDYLLMQVTSRLHSDNLSLLILQNDFKEYPLLKQSELRLHKIFILHESLIESKITSATEKFMEKVVNKLLLLLL